jgi:hypothetical protein
MFRIYSRHQNLRISPGSMTDNHPKPENENLEDVLSPSIKTIKEYVQAYPQYVPKQLEELDPVRYETMPDTLRKRKAEGESYLEKDEVLKLVKWKLSHGKFRPNLMNLVSKNSEEAVRESTSKGFAEKDTIKGLDVLTKLSGIGPATAALLLSVNDPEIIPFFSDELFRFSQLTQDGDGGVTGWDRKIAYNKKEYVGLLTFCTELRESINETAIADSTVSMLDLEKYAYVLHAKRAENAGSKKGTKRTRAENLKEEEEEADPPGQADEGNKTENRPKRTRTQTKSKK